jgi:virginiamycin B lyase
MATDASGGLWVYVADYGAAGRLTRFVSNGNQLTVTAGCSVFGDVDTLAYGPDGNLYPAASAVGTPTIYKVSPTCGILGTFTPPVPSRIASMVFGSDGALWMIFRSANNVIGHLTTSGTYTELHVPFAGSALSAITKGSDGAVWFTDAGTNAIGRVTTTGAFSEFHVPTPHAFKGGSGGIVSCPTKCENAHGRIWFSEDAASKIGKLEF